MMRCISRTMTKGQLTRVNPTDGTGALTTQYLTDRALFLKEKIALNQLDQDTTSRNIHFLDVASNYEIKTPTHSCHLPADFSSAPTTSTP